VDRIDPEPAVVERDATIDEQDLSALLESEAVHPYLAQTAEGNETKGRHSANQARERVAATRRRRHGRAPWRRLASVVRS
jgi:hypothetical protein